MLMKNYSKSKRWGGNLAGFILEIIGNFPKRTKKLLPNCLFTVEAVDQKNQTNKSNSWININV
jgi:hypothetical protein